jgi:hypothetical protein
MFAPNAFPGCDSTNGHREPSGGGPWDCLKKSANDLPARKTFNPLERQEQLLVDLRLEATLRPRGVDLRKWDNL